MALRPVGQRVHQARRLAIDARPIVHRGARQSRGMGDGRQVQDQVGGTAEGRVHHQGIAHRGVVQDAAHGQAGGFHCQDGARRAARHIGPDRVSRGSQRGVRQRHPERFADHLRGGRRAQKLAAAAGHQDARQRARGGERHHHRREALVAGGHADYAAARGQGADEAAEDGGGVVAVGQRIEHPGGALRTAVAGVGAVGRKGDGAERLQLLGGGIHQQADFPVTGVVAERDRGAIGRADAAVGAQDENFLPAQRRGIPAHARVLRPAEDVARGPRDQHFGGHGQRAGGAGNFAADVVKGGIAGIQELRERSRHVFLKFSVLTGGKMDVRQVGALAGQRWEEAPVSVGVLSARPQKFGSTCCRLLQMSYRNRRRRSLRRYCP